MVKNAKKIVLLTLMISSLSGLVLSFSEDNPSCSLPIKEMIHIGLRFDLTVLVLASPQRLIILHLAFAIVIGDLYNYYYTLLWFKFSTN